MLSKTLREMKDLRRLSREKKDVVIYSESRNYYPNFEGLIKKLNHLGYVTSDFADPILEQPSTYYVDGLLPIYMTFANCKVLVMTMTDLNSFHIKRSTHPVHYVYIFHSMASTHMVYRYGAFDHYDSLLCVGPHQIEEIRRSEKLYGLRPKNLIEAGYYGVERLYDAYRERKEGNGRVAVLVAPTWGTSNLLSVCGKELIETLLREDYDVTLRLHPETVKRHYTDYRGVTLETSVVDIKSLVEADILITDWSAIGLEYALGTERPVIFIDTPPKVRNPRYKELDIEPIESRLRSEIGVIVPLSGLNSLPGVILNMLRGRHLYRSTIQRLRSKYLFNFGRSSEVGANYIRSLLQ